MKGRSLTKNTLTLNLSAKTRRFLCTRPSCVRNLLSLPLPKAGKAWWASNCTEYSFISPTRLQNRGRGQCNFLDDELPLVERLVEAFYTGQYREDVEDGEFPDESISKIQLHVRMYLLADKYQCDGVAEHAFNRFLVAIGKTCQFADFSPRFPRFLRTTLLLKSYKRRLLKRRERSCLYTATDMKDTDCTEKRSSRRQTLDGVFLMSLSKRHQNGKRMKGVLPRKLATCEFVLYGGFE